MVKQKHPKKIVRSKRAHLVHHRHTAKLLHKQHTSYPLIGLLLLCIGVFMTYMTFQVSAAQVTVTASNPNGPLPTVPATILSPTEGQQFTSVPVPVSGTCDPGFVVKLFRNDLFSGSGICSPTGQFSIVTDLFDGTNILTAKIYNAADREGPTSPPVTIFYDEPVNPSVPKTSKPLEPFYVTTDYYYLATKSEVEIKWRFKPVGGTPEYSLHVLWGDGLSDQKSGLSKDWLELKHTYDPPPTHREYYPVLVTVTDAQGRKAYLQVFAIVNDTTLYAATTTSGGDNYLVIAWPAYVLTLLLGVAFWLGEKRGQAMRPKMRVNRV